MVPGCRHARGDRKNDPLPPVQNYEWICGEHWRAIPAARRRVYHRANRIKRSHVAAILWRRLKRLAIERAAGIA